MRKQHTLAVQVLILYRGGQAVRINAQKGQMLPPTEVTLGYIFQLLGRTAMNEAIHNKRVRTVIRTA